MFYDSNLLNSIELNTLNLFYETLLEISFKIKIPN